MKKTEETKEYKLSENGQAVDELVLDYIRKTNKSPFINIDLINEETGEINIDMDKNFEEELEILFGSEEDVSNALSNYFSYVIYEASKLSPEELEKIKNTVENTETTQKE